MPKHIHVLRENAYNIPIGTAMVTNTEANAMIADGSAIEVPAIPLPQQTQETPPTIIVQQSEPKPKTTTIKRNRKQGPMKTKFSNSKIKKS